ncbi:MAG: hypothetical protein ACFCVE_09410 [Phycisphaerae bacterium]
MPATRRRPPATACPADTFARFFHALLTAGVMIAPARFEALFISTTHDEEALDLTTKALHAAFAAVKEGGEAKTPAGG